MTGGLKISVITVCYNAAEKIEKTIESVSGQTYRNIEYIIVDGASTDSTVELISKYDDRIIWLSEPDEGLYDAMNKGIEKATGDWIYFLGAGDILLDVINTVIPELKDDHCIYYGNVFRHDIQRRYDGKFSGFKLAVSNICHQAVFYPSTVFKKYRYELKYSAMADHELNIRCYGDKEFRFQYLPIEIAEYEGGGFSARTPDNAFFADKLRLIRENFPLPVYWYALIRNKLARALKH